MNARLDADARLYEAVAEELEQAAGHARTAAQHFRENEIPRAAAHAWAAQGHVLEAQEKLDAQAREHARRSQA